MRPLAALLLAGSALLVPQSAWAAPAEGPGYSGDAGGLSVYWVRGDDQALPPAVPADNPAGEQADPQRVGITSDGMALEVTGIGFRGLSEVTVQVGNAELLTTRADETGTIAVSVPAPDAAAPGTSVVAIGRGPAGGARTITGAVPPQPYGANLMAWARYLILVLALLAVLAATARAWQQRRDLTGLPAPTGPPAPLPMPAPRGRAVALPPPGHRPPLPPPAVPLAPTATQPAREAEAATAGT